MLTSFSGFQKPGHPVQEDHTSHDLEEERPGGLRQGQGTDLQGGEDHPPKKTGRGGCTGNINKLVNKKTN
mgnify:CR=1 FL=1